MNQDFLIDAFWKLSNKDFRNYLEHADVEKFPFARYIIHAHTDLGSPKDSVLTIDKYVKAAVRMGAKAISVTDHGTMYAVQPLYKACKKHGIKLLVGCEFYVCESVEDMNRKKHTRLHLCGYAKDEAGYRALTMMVTASNERILVIKTYDGDLSYPCISKKILEKYVGPGSDGHGHVILTSACVGGVLSGMSFANNGLKTDIEIIKERIGKGKDVMASINRILSTQKELEEKRTAFEEMLHSADCDETRKEWLEQQISTIKNLSKQVKPELRKKEKQMCDLTKRKGCTLELLAQDIKALEKECTVLEAGLIPEDKMVSFFESEALWYDKLAGHGNWFVELQYHGIPVELKYMQHMAQIAEQLDIPVVAANDAHMELRSDLELRKLINSLRFNKYEEAQEGDSELYLKSDIELFRMLSKAVTPDYAFKAMLGRQQLAEQCCFELKKVPNYPQYIP